MYNMIENSKLLFAEVHKTGYAKIFVKCTIGVRNPKRHKRTIDVLSSHGLDAETRIYVHT